MPKRKLIEAKQYMVTTDWMESQGMKGLVIEYPSNYPGLSKIKTIVILYSQFATKAPCIEFDYHASKEIITEKLNYLRTKLDE